MTLDTQEPVLTFLESGLPLADGALFNRTVVPVVVATDATQVNLSVTLNGSPFTSGTPVADEGSYELQATAIDEGGNAANLSASFVIDATAPSFIAVLPPDSTLVAVPEIALSGEVAGAQSVTVDGLACTLTVEAFACSSFPLADGERIFTLLARDAAGNEAPRQHRIRRDGTGPEVVIATPAEGAYLASASVAGQRDGRRSASRRSARQRRAGGSRGRRLERRAHLLRRRRRDDRGDRPRHGRQLDRGLLGKSRSTPSLPRSTSSSRALRWATGHFSTARSLR